MFLTAPQTVENNVKNESAQFEKIDAFFDVQIFQSTCVKQHACLVDTLGVAWDFSEFQTFKIFTPKEGARTQKKPISRTHVFDFGPPNRNRTHQDHYRGWPGDGNEEQLVAEVRYRTKCKRQAMMVRTSPRPDPASAPPACMRLDAYRIKGQPTAQDGDVEQWHLIVAITLRSCGRRSIP